LTMGPLAHRIASSQMNKVVLYTKPGCCLCDTVKTQLAKLQSKKPFEITEINILDDPEAYAEFHQQIPVVFIDGRKAFKYHLDEAEFLRRLKQRPA
jgi:glutaredoxin